MDFYPVVLQRRCLYVDNNVLNETVIIGFPMFDKTEVVFVVNIERVFDINWIMP